MSEAEQIQRAWDEALSKNDVEALLALYHPDAIIESPLIPHLLGTAEGVCRGHEEMRPLFQLVAQRKPPVRKFYKNPLFTDGRLLMWEYPRETPDGEQMDFVEVMEIEAGKIRKHRVYWGWRGYKVMQENAYHR